MTNGYNATVVLPALTRLGWLQPGTRGYDIVDCDNRELTRAQYDGSTVSINNTRRDASNKNFLVYIKKQPAPGQVYYELDRSATNISGIDFRKGHIIYR